MWASTTQNTPSIFAPVIALYFNHNEEVEFQKFLYDRSASTEVVPVVDSNQLLMAVNGKLSESGYRYTMIGFNAVCGAVSNGLASLFYEISGENMRKIAMEPEDINLPAAVGIYNTAVQVRFNSLIERSLLVGHTENTVDGFLGIEHKYLDNSVFFDLVLEELKSRQPTAEFHRAEVVGREVCIYMIDKSSRRDDFLKNKRHTFASGWFFSNREDTGSAAYATQCLYTRFGPAIIRRRGTKLAHVGADLVGRAVSLISRAANHTVDMDRVKKQVHRLINKKIGFSDDQVAHNKALSRCSTLLGRFGVPRDAARLITQNAIAVGSDLDPRDFSDMYDTAAMKNRTGYDLVCSVLRHAKTQSSHTKIALQSAAMDILLPQEKKDDKR